MQLLHSGEVAEIADDGELHGTHSLLFIFIECSFCTRKAKIAADDTFPGGGVPLVIISVTGDTGYFQLIHS